MGFSSRYSLCCLVTKIQLQYFYNSAQAAHNHKILNEKHLSIPYNNGIILSIFVFCFVYAKWVYFYAKRSHYSMMLQITKERRMFHCDMGVTSCNRTNNRSACRGNSADTSDSPQALGISGCCYFVVKLNFYSFEIIIEGYFMMDSWYLYTSLVFSVCHIHLFSCTPSMHWTLEAVIFPLLTKFASTNTTGSRHWMHTNLETRSKTNQSIVGVYLNVKPHIQKSDGHRLWSCENSCF